MLAIDIFSFVPVPRTRTVSTKRSKLGSILIILIFLVYVVYDFVALLTNNTPKLNTYEVPLQSSVNLPIDIVSCAANGDRLHLRP